MLASAAKKGSVSRSHSGVFLGAVGLACNGLLVLGKCLIGLATNSVALLADGLNNFSDMISVLITLVSFKLSAKSADKQHPYGYGRMEYICGLLVAVLIVLTGLQLLETVLGRLHAPEPISVCAWTTPFLLTAIAVKVLLAALGTYCNRGIASIAIKTCVTDSLLDACATGSILLATLAAPYSTLPLDAILGLVLTAIIFASGLKAFKSNLDPLLGASPDNDLAAKISAMVQSIDGLNNVHQLEIHDYGPARRAATMHVQISSDCDLAHANHLVELLQKRLWEELQLAATIHLELIDKTCYPQGGVSAHV